MYALGITAYEMIVGKRPYPEQNLDALVDMHVNVDIPDPAEAVPGLPEGVGQFILKACRRNPAARYQNADEALEDLLTIARSLDCLEERLDSEPRKMTTILLSYSETQDLKLKRALEKFGQDCHEIEVVMKSADLGNI